MLPSDVAAYAVPLLLSCIAVFVGGLGEDIGREVSPKMRLILSFISALCAIAIFRVWIGPLGSLYLNWITSTLLGATVFTVLISGGVAHATNLIDGSERIGNGCVYADRGRACIFGPCRG